MRVRGNPTFTPHAVERSWERDGSLAPGRSNLGTSVLFTSSGQRSLRVSVRDADNLAAVDEIKVHVTIIPLEGSQQPF